MKTPLAIVALIGGTLVLISGYLQSGSMDLNRFAIDQYIATDVSTYVWWAAIGFPFLVGVCFLSVAVSCIRLRTTRQTTMWVLGGCLVVAVVLGLVNLGWGVYAAISTLIALASAIRQGASRTI